MGGEPGESTVTVGRDLDGESETIEVGRCGEGEGENRLCDTRVTGALTWSCGLETLEASDNDHGEGLRGMSREARSEGCLSSEERVSCGIDLGGIKDGTWCCLLFVIPSKWDLSDDTGLCIAQQSEHPFSVMVAEAHY